MTTGTTGGTSLLLGLTEEEARSFSSLLKRCVIEEDEVIFYEREPEASLAFIRSGRVHVYRRGIRVRSLGPGAVLSAGTAMTQCEHVVRAVAGERVELAVLSPDGLEHLRGLDHPVLPRLERVALTDLSNWIREMDHQIKQEGVARPVSFAGAGGSESRLKPGAGLLEPAYESRPTLDIEETLGSSPLFRGASSSVVRVIAGFFTTASIRRGQVLNSPGEPSSGIWLPVSGALEVWVPVSSGRAIAFVQPRSGVWVGDIPACDGKPGHLWVRCIRAGSALHMSVADVHHLLEDDGPAGAGFRQVVLRNLMGRVRPRLDWCVGNQSGRHETVGRVLGHHEREIWR